MLEPIRQSYSGKALRILIADRNSHVRNFLKRELEADHHQISTARGVNEMLNALRNDPTFDLVILDPHFPGMGNFEKFRKFMGQFPCSTFILHLYSLESEFTRLSGCNVKWIEKSGNSIDIIKSHIYLIQSGNPVSETTMSRTTRYYDGPVTNTEKIK